LKCDIFKVYISSVDYLSMINEYTKAVNRTNDYSFSKAPIGIPMFQCNQQQLLWFDDDVLHFPLDQDFSNCGMHITTGIPATVQWYIGIARKNKRWKKIKILSFNKYSYIKT
jgi:hypothetical protein